MSISYAPQSCINGLGLLGQTIHKIQEDDRSLDKMNIPMVERPIRMNLVENSIKMKRRNLSRIQHIYCFLVSIIRWHTNIIPF